MPTPATVYISESNGVAEVVTDDISNINFGSVDTPNLVAASHPVIIGESSFYKALRFKVQSLGDSTTIKDIRFWKSSGAYVTGEDLRFKVPVGYIQPSDATLSATSTIYVADPGSATWPISGNVNNTIIAAPTYADYLFFQAWSTPSTPVGPANTKTITIQYDET